MGIVLWLCAWLAPSSCAYAGNQFKGPVEGKVVTVRDGDTFHIEAEIWPRQFLRIDIRIRGIDAPEMKARCASERRMALAARDRLTQFIGERTVILSNIGGAKYYGRVLADVATEDGQAIADLMLGSRTVREYDGGRRQAWCPKSGADP